MDSDIALIIGIMIGLGVGFGMAYFILQMQNRNQKLVIMRNTSGQIEGIVQS